MTSTRCDVSYRSMTLFTFANHREASARDRVRRDHCFDEHAPHRHMSVGRHRHESHCSGIVARCCRRTSTGNAAGGHWGYATATRAGFRQGSQATATFPPQAPLCSREEEIAPLAARVQRRYAIGC